MPLPAWFLDEPPALPFSDFFHHHFWRLDSERPLGAVPGRIPESRVCDYALRLGLPADMIALFTDLILSMDQAYLRWLADKRAEQAQRKT